MLVIQTVIVFWSIICGWVLFDAISHTASFAEVPLPVFFALIVWSIVCLPTAFIGLSLRRRPSHRT